MLVIQSKNWVCYELSKIENKITDHDHSNKYITGQEFNKLTANKLAARLKEANFTTKADIDDFLENTDFDDTLIKFK